MSDAVLWMAQTAIDQSTPLRHVHDPTIDAANRDSDSSSSEDDSEGEWVEEEPDEEEPVSIKCLLCDQTFPQAIAMLEHCKTSDGFNFLQEKARLNLEYIDTVKFINYIRFEVNRGNKDFAEVHADDFASEEYFHSPLDDDPLLWSLGDLDDIADEADPAISDEARKNINDCTSPACAARIKHLEGTLEKIQSLYMSEMLADQSTESSSTSEGLAMSKGFLKPTSTTSPAAPVVSQTPDDSADYFRGYSFNSIHRTMLEDRIRTDAYRDFIMDNKHIFKDKTILDVGCGTGILSMFCAKAGAKRVYAVDNSAIFDRAREIIYTNKLDHIITVLKGDIEKIDLPGSPKVDIIVSEWMGYALLYEKMLNSVLIARDRFLKPDGLMVPSHCTLRVAPYINNTEPDPPLGEEFWYDVYGFDMRPMVDEARLRNGIIEIESIPAERIIGTPSTFLTLPLATIKAEELEFTAPFATEMTRDVPNIDGLCLWFDTFFLPKRTDVLPADAVAETWPQSAPGNAFTTGPGGKTTHWGMGVLPFRAHMDLKNLDTGEKMDGSVAYKYAGRGVEVEVAWHVEGKKMEGKQVWKCEE